MNMSRIKGTQVHVSGMFIMRRPEELKEANITHVVSVLRGPLDMTLFAPYKHLHIESDDDEGANLIESFATTNSFIDEGIEQGGGVLVHCAVGISRSVTIATAYLVYKYRMSADMALELVQKSRPVACPNLDFRIQLHIYANNLDQATKNLNEVPSYQKYLYRKEAKRSQITNKPPDIQYFADDNVAVQGNQKCLRCKKCKFTLANENAFVTHTPDDDSQCDVYFIDPNRWMTSEFEKGLLEGKLQCPVCNLEIGTYAWQGATCSCGAPVIPAISIPAKLAELNPPDKTGKFSFRDFVKKKISK